MSKLLVVSDSHGDDQILTALAKRYAGEVDVLIHAGDSEFYPRNPLIADFQIVVGNMDYGTDFPVSINLDLPEARVFVTHGHKYNVNFGLNTIYLAGREQDADIIIYGHTHQLLTMIDYGVLIVNPGSISLPRGEYARIGGTYAIIDVAADSFRVQYYTREFKLVEELSFEFPRL
ncbi:phosphoesterase [Amylolactobacillus amylotrophicus DSM 20534]|uniref:Uncharacterized protein n=3 Tax=Amylolactobacillus TaxID=2767876 RepID=A0A1L6XAP2_9LACO|nr:MULTISPECIES: metallophosphoesterase [Amylolactobacillus]APT18054.1 hypothetical protein LA20533_01605 [Amylolactobacillus amylophilus DSM 20533 = JCM 1125]KRK37399.1 phosphoesterase [Amylolactobacillus amylotrophicus DSM 20534]KRM42072.1 phosphoesterase [Amylolactobacillus amylophilus DSM 20533 = JCM 1125]